MMNNNGGEDRLSSLPDPILIDILSRLPTNTAATTAILSPRWHYLWTHITSIDINCRKFTTSIDKFADIDKVFQRLASPLINSFTLRGCDRSRGSEWLSDLSKHVNSWLHQICDSKVQKICIKVIERDFKLMNTVTPSIIFQTPALVVLELVSELSCFVPDHAIKDDTTTTNFNLPKLKKLSVTVLLFHCNFWGRLIKSCPSLENLSMVICHIRQPRKIIADINISAKNLERLNLELIGCKLLAKVTIDAPSLKYLSRFKLGIYRLVNLESLKAILKYCSLLETLILTFDLSKDQNNIDDDYIIDISAPNLKALVINSTYVSSFLIKKFVIDTPLLEEIEIKDCIASYCFVETLSYLKRASIVFRDSIDRNCRFKQGNALYTLIPVLFRGMSNANYFKLKGGLAIYNNALFPVDANVWSLFRNLTHLRLSLSKTVINWGSAIPLCLLPKLKKIDLLKINIIGGYNDANLVQVILSNAHVLEKLYISCIASKNSNLGDYKKKPITEGI
uniref:F-box domain-containing protein n=1 Tax=Chenopodium quinoa TaxID=63459 RepID=A0A803LUC8_CHEQI